MGEIFSRVTVSTSNRVGDLNLFPVEPFSVFFLNFERILALSVRERMLPGTCFFIKGLKHWAENRFA